MLVWICRVNLETLKWRHPHWVLDRAVVDRVGYVHAKRVEAGVELIAVLSMDGVKIGWILVESRLRMLMLVKDLRSESLI